MNSLPFHPAESSDLIQESSMVSTLEQALFFFFSFFCWVLCVVAGVCLWVAPNLNCVDLQSLGHLGNGETEATECTTKLLFFCRHTHFLYQVKLNSDLLTICWKFTQKFEKIHFQEKKKHWGKHSTNSRIRNCWWKEGFGLVS